MENKVWLITGSGSGLGRVIAEAALAAGYSVVATARDITSLSDLADRYDEQVLPAKLDVTDEAQAKSTVERAVARFGRIDVLVNNAGYGDTRPFEQVPAAEFRQLVETCFFGVVNLTRHVLPVMRKQRGGHIIQISSLGGRTAFPGNAAYFASKWAIGGFTEGLALETAPFGVKVTALEPGAMRTNWGKRAHQKDIALLPEYEASVGAGAKAVAHLWGNESGDPVRVARLILKIAATEQLPPHILLGSDAYTYARNADEKRWADAEKWQSVSRYIDFGGADELPDFPGK